MTSIRIVLVDDHTVVSQGIEMLLSDYPDLEVVGAAPSGEAAIAICAELRPQVVLMDLSMPGMNGVEATSHLVSADPGIRVIALTGQLDDELVRGVVAAGACGYLLKSLSGDELAEAIRTAARGQAILSLEALTRVQVADAAPPKPSLTSRELDVLSLLVEGATNKSIAIELSLSPGTVRVHVSNILAKLEADNRTAAARQALRLGLVSDPGG